MKNIALFFLISVVFGCKNDAQKTENNLSDISEKSFRKFKVEDSNYIDLEELWAPFQDQLSSFSIEKYEALKPLIMNQAIPALQRHVQNKKLSYEALVTFYLYRINLLDRENKKSLNSVISLNTSIIEEAREKDKKRPKNLSVYSIYGMPILLKDNINANGMVTTAGAVALMKNTTEDSFLSQQLKSSGALILGKANLSEWAYFFCGDCPSGYSAVGGQTFNPYGRKTLDTGGSSSGSAVAVAANFCAAAIGSETAGSILSPASQNAGVGLKPTIGTVSRSGIVPISSTLDTAGPITKSIIDNVLVYNAIIGYDDRDFKSTSTSKIDLKTVLNTSFEGKRFGAIKELLEDSLYLKSIKLLEKHGAEIITIEPENVNLPNFLRLLNLDMKADLPLYFQNHANKNMTFNDVQSIIDYNILDSIRAPYGQKLFQGIVEDSATPEEFSTIKSTLKTNGKAYFDTMMIAHELDGVLSVNNYHASYAAVAEYPALTVPMGLNKENAPMGLTFITKPFQEGQLYQWGYHFEKVANKRPLPNQYN